MCRTIAIMVAWVCFASATIYILQINGMRGVVQHHIKQEFKCSHMGDGYHMAAIGIRKDTR